MKSQYHFASVIILWILTVLFSNPASAALVHRYSFGVGAEDSVGHADGTLENGASVFGGQVHCDGVDDYVNLPAVAIDINDYHTVTLEMWLTQPTIDQSYGMAAALGGTWGNGTGRDYLFIATSRGDNVSRGAIAHTPDQDSPWSDETGVNGPELNDNQEHQYVVIVDDQNLSYYVDGELQGTEPLDSSHLSDLSNDAVYLARSLYNADASLQCSIDEFRIYNTALTACQIQKQAAWGPNQLVSNKVQITESDGSTALTGSHAQTGDTYTVRLLEVPSAPVTVTVDPPAELDLGAGAGQSIHLVFTPQNSRVAQTVHVALAQNAVATQATMHIQQTTSSEDDTFDNLPLYDVCVSLDANNYVINTTDQLGHIDEKVYGHFLEHIYHSVNGGLWGDMIWNRSFEMLGSSGGFWLKDANELTQNSTATNVHLLFGQASWTDYELTCEAEKTGGSEGFLIICRANGNKYYWFNLGGWGNTQDALEKGRASGNRSIVPGTSLAGSIPTGQWMAIRARCEGNRLRIWLDGNLLIDYTDPSAYLSGQVGLGTWATQARFRNIEVHDLNNHLLFSGVPDVSATMPDFWTQYGTGEVTIAGNALNDDYCVYMNPQQGEATGLEQDKLHVTPQAYIGSFWARGNGTMQIRLLNGTQELQHLSIPVTGDSWTEVPFTFTPPIEVNDATLQIGLDGPGEVWIDQVSMMGQDAIDTGGYRPDLLIAVEGLHPPVIRWPGGCYASGYFWKDCIGPQYTRKKYQTTLWDDQETNSFGTDEFCRMCEDIGAKPIIVINSGVLKSTCGVSLPIQLPPEEYLQDALDWIEYCNGDANSTTWGAKRAANGHPEPYHVKYWEIDNETWSAGVNAYIAKVLEFSPAMRAADPNIKIIACGGGGYDQNWNRAVLDACANDIDYLSVHYYASADSFKNEPIKYEQFIKDLGNIIAASDNPNVKIDNSEWNAQSTDWRTGLYAGGLLNAFERQCNVFAIGGPALFLRHLSATGWDNAFINFDQTGWFPAPNYVVMKLWHDHYAPTLLQTVHPDSDLNLVSTLSADQQTVYCKLVNPDNQTQSITLTLDNSFQPGNATMEWVAPGSLSARNSLQDSNNVYVETQPLDVNGQHVPLTLPAYSASVIAVTRK